jgi:hypothetical protein
MNERMSPKGTFLSTRGPGNFRVGGRVEVTRGQFGRAGNLVLDRDLSGSKGTFLGWSIPHGFAVVQTDDGGEFMVHPESLERSR